MFDDAWGLFPGISVGWRIVDEAFWANNIAFFDDFKIEDPGAKLVTTGFTTMDRYRNTSSLPFIVS